MGPGLQLHEIYWVAQVIIMGQAASKGGEGHNQIFAGSVLLKRTIQGRGGHYTEPPMEEGGIAENHPEQRGHIKNLK